MWMKLLICNLFIGLVFCDQFNDNEFYTAAAVEYGYPIPTDEINITPERYVMRNLNEYIKLIRLAKENNVDIIVFPEATFNYFLTRELCIKNGIEVPNPDDKIAPYKDEQCSEILQKLSKHSKDNQIYVLVNLVEKVRCNVSGSESCKREDGFNLYNTNVIFDRQGRIISKYHKLHLFMEPNMEIPENDPYSTFTTDFNVKFGHFICFDIVFQVPALNLLKNENVTNILYPSMWFSELPFLTAVQVHSGWAYANNVNLISSGANNPHLGNSGTGIYLGRNSNHPKIITGKDADYLLISKVPKNINNSNSEILKPLPESSSNTIVTNKNPDFTAHEMKSLRLLEVWSDLGAMKWDIEKDLNKPQKICVDNDLCCLFDLKFKKLDVPDDKIGITYKLVANITARWYGTQQTSGEIYCAIISCTNNSSNSCGKRYTDHEKYAYSMEFNSIKITSIIPADEFENVLFMPNSLTTSILPLDTNQFKFRKLRQIQENGISYNKYLMESNMNLENVLTFGIFGRSFAHDDKVILAENNYLSKL